MPSGFLCEKLCLLIQQLAYDTAYPRSLSWPNQSRHVHTSSKVLHLANGPDESEPQFESGTESVSESCLQFAVRFATSSSPRCTTLFHSSALPHLVCIIVNYRLGSLEFHLGLAGTQSQFVACQLFDVDRLAFRFCQTLTSVARQLFFTAAHSIEMKYEFGEKLISVRLEKGHLTRAITSRPQSLYQVLDFPFLFLVAKRQSCNMSGFATAQARGVFKALRGCENVANLWEIFYKTKI